MFTLKRFDTSPGFRAYHDGQQVWRFYSFESDIWKHLESGTFELTEDSSGKFMLHRDGFWVHIGVKETSIGKLCYKVLARVTKIKLAEGETKTYTLKRIESEKTI